MEQSVKIKETDGKYISRILRRKNKWNQVEQSVKIKETDGMEIGRGGGRCDLVGKKGEPAAIKEEKKGGLVQASASADSVSLCYC